MESLKNARLIVLAIAMILPATGAIAAPHFEHHDANVDHEGGHYSDKGAKPTKAERLGVKMQSRALIDKAGNTEFELTTGKLDDTTTPPGNIDKLEVELQLPPSAKHHDGKEGREKEGFEKEYNHLKGGGYFHDYYTKLARGQTLNVKTRVSGFGNANRHENESDHEGVKIELADVVKYRPDVTVQKVDYSPTAQPDTAVVFSAVIKERKGDLGAHHDCVLFVDGTAVDTIPGIWVDAGSVVTCKTSYKFKGGTHTVQVKAQNVRPGDYDPSSVSSAVGSILIQNPNSLVYSVDATDSFETVKQSTDEYYSAASTVPDHHTDVTQTNAYQSRYFSGHIPAAVGLPLKTLSYADSSDGVALNAFSFTDVSADSTFPSGDPAYTTETLIARSDASGGQLTIHRYLNANTGVGKTTIDVGWDGGEATYASNEYCKIASGYPCVGGDYTLNTPPTITSAAGALVKLGASYAANLVIDDGTAYTASPSMPLAPSPSSQSYIGLPQCYPGTSADWTKGQTCSQFSDVLVAKEGYVSVGQ